MKNVGLEKELQHLIFCLEPNSMDNDIINYVVNSLKDIQDNIANEKIKYAFFEMRGLIECIVNDMFSKELESYKNLNKHKKSGLAEKIYALSTLDKFENIIIRGLNSLRDFGNEAAHYNQRTSTSIDSFTAQLTTIVPIMEWYFKNYQEFELTESDGKSSVWESLCIGLEGKADYRKRLKKTTPIEVGYININKDEYNEEEQRLCTKIVWNDDVPIKKRIGDIVHLYIPNIKLSQRVLQVYSKFDIDQDNDQTFTLIPFVKINNQEFHLTKTSQDIERSKFCIYIEETDLDIYLTGDNYYWETRESLKYIYDYKNKRYILEDFVANSYFKHFIVCDRDFNKVMEIRKLLEDNHYIVDGFGDLDPITNKWRVWFCDPRYLIQYQDHLNNCWQPSKLISYPIETKK